MHALDVSTLTDRSQLGAAVRGRSWEWLFALRKRLNVDLQLVDDAQAPLLTVSGEPAFDELFSGSTPGIRLAVSTAIRTRTPQAANVDRLQTVVVPITADRAVGGALIVARRTGEDQPFERIRGELEAVGFWLANAIEAHLQSAPASQGDLDRLSALSQMLDDAASRGSDRGIVSAFVDTLAVWHDLEGYGFVATPGGDYHRDVALPGADLTRTPAVISRSALPELDDIAFLAKSDMDRLGFSGGDDLVLAHAGEGAGAWLVAIAGSIQQEDLIRFGLYVALLKKAVESATHAATARMLAVLASTIVGDTAAPEDQARLALTEIQKALGMTSAAFTATSRTGAPLVHAGSSYTAADLAAGSNAGRVVEIRRDPQHYAMALVGSWDADHRVTQLEHRVVVAAADLLEAWVRRLAHQRPRAAERRASQRSFDDVLERAARNAVQGGIPVTAVVINFPDTASRPDLTHARVVTLREHLRGGDLVGRLGEGEVGVLLQDADPAQARVPIARVRRVLEREGVPWSRIGTASRNPGEPLTAALSHEARQAAYDDSREH